MIARAPIAWMLVATFVTACTPATSLPIAPAPTSAPSASIPARSAVAAAPSAAWRRIADIPTPRSEVASAVSLSNHVYVIGGLGGPQRVERYDVAADRWDRVPDLPIGVDHAMAAAVEGLQSSAPQGVFVLGGNQAGGGATARSFRLDTVQSRWEEIAPMPGPRAAGAAVVWGGTIYVLGGADGNRLVAPTWAYDVAARAWRTVAAIPTPRDHLAGTVIPGKVCAVGGRRLSLSLNLGTFECYTPGTDMWERLPDLPTARGGLAAAVFSGVVYVIGGEQPSGTFREVEIFDWRAGTWTRGPDLATGRHGLAVAVVQGTKRIVGGVATDPPWHLLVLAGGPTPGGSQMATSEAMDLR